MKNYIAPTEQPITIIPDWLIDTPLISIQAKILFICLKRHQNKETRTSYPGITTLARKCCMSISSVKRATAQLEDLGLLEVIRETTCYGVKKNNVYKLNESPELAKAKTVEELRQMAKATAAERLTDEELLEETKRRGFTILKGGQKDTEKGLPVLPDTESPDHRICEKQLGDCSIDETPYNSYDTTQQEGTQVGKVYEICPNTTKTHLIGSQNRYMVGYDGLSEEPPAAALEAEEPTSRATELPEEGGQAPMYTNEDVRALLDYDEYIERYEESERELIDETIPIIRNVMNSRAASFRINGADVPAEVMRAQYAKLTLEHIAWAVDNVGRQASRTEIKNHDAYMRAALFDAPRQYRQRCRDHAAYYVMGEGQRAIAPPV